MKLLLGRIGLLTLSFIMILGTLTQTAFADTDGSVVSPVPKGQVYLSPARPLPPQNQANTGSILVDLAGAPTKKINTTIVGTVITSYVNNQNKIAEGFGNTANRYYSAYEKSGNINTFNNFVKNSDKAFAAETRALQAKAFGKVLSGASLVNSISKYNNPSKHKHSSIAFFEQWLRGVSIGTSGADLAGFKPVKPVGIAVGILKDAVSGETFSNWANSWDNPVINNIDYGVDAVNNEALFVISYWYEFFNSTDDANVFGRPPRGVGVYKPNIYLYPVKESKITVTFDAPALLTKTIPAYCKDWEVTASPDGSLRSDRLGEVGLEEEGLSTDGLGADKPDNNTGDNEEYGYLFYESMTDPALFTFHSGWVLRSATREKQFHQILAEYGFNERETADFIAFWTEKLDSGIDYTMYPILTDAVNSAMPIHVSPAPDNSFRLWFAFKSFDGNAPPVPAVSPMDRSGYSLVEWGGLILDETGG